MRNTPYHLYGLACENKIREAVADLAGLDLKLTELEPNEAISRIVNEHGLEEIEFADGSESVVCYDKPEERIYVKRELKNCGAIKMLSTAGYIPSVPESMNNYTLGGMDTGVLFQIYGKKCHIEIEANATSQEHLEQKSKAIEFLVAKYNEFAIRTNAEFTRAHKSTIVSMIARAKSKQDKQNQTINELKASGMKVDIH